ncbi:S26 family signal peptidase [Nonomuraea sp. NPDC050556]|uniref:S26 family signal peptidase n=1 Tax=Nonomuraea sp. NPDC050556 TaxID=3364369 RepID=UPI0037AFE9F9
MPVIIVLGVVLAALLVARNRLAVVTVRGESMVPTLRPGDRVLLLRTRRLRRGRIVVLEPIGPGLRWRKGPIPAPADGEWLVKRLTALPGDPTPAEVAEGPVPRGHLVVLGDGKVSADSRLWGYVPADRVLGIVIYTLVRTS